MADDKNLGIEIAKLLLQVAWADHDVAEEEIEPIVALARDSGASDAGIEAVRACLRGERRLPPPDLGFLRAHKDVALEAVRQVIRADSEIAAEERDVLDEIRTLLEA